MTNFLRSRKSLLIAGAALVLVVLAWILASPGGGKGTEKSAEKAVKAALSVTVTQAIQNEWPMRLSANGSIAAWSALFASREVWAIYNGGVAYLLMGALFAGEWLFRRHVRSSH